uniref:Class I SAM-dependent methyltransferase n=1 Tax=Fervidicoccus fontis TaxID=683846 RepID=A0A7J3ZLD0_9CREN
MNHYFKGKAFGTRSLLLETIGGVTLRLYSSEGVFSKDRVDLGTRLLLENLVIPPQGEVLDVGTGIGVIGIFVAKKNPKLRVFMSDVNPRALELAKQNAVANNVQDRVIVLKSDVYDAFSGKLFDAIYSNPPLSAGWSVVERIIVGAPLHLKSAGFLQAVFARGEERAISLGKEHFREVKVLKRKKGYSIILFEV